MKRNAGRKVGYKPAYADEQTKARRWTGSKLDAERRLHADVLGRLARGVSPEQVAGRLARENAAERVSHETIYRFIYAQIARTKDYTWRHYLPRAKSKRGIRGGRGGSSACFIQARVSIHNRDPEALDRRTPGHWEADLMMFRQIRTGRPHRCTSGTRASCSPHGPTTKPPTSSPSIVIRLLQMVPNGLRRTITFDNGTEFARHSRLHPLGLQTFFCDPHAPWQKGGIENAIGRMRRFLPRKTDLATISTGHFHRILSAYNSTPRKCLDFQTPAEVFLDQLLHFKCESTSPPAPG